MITKCEQQFMKLVREDRLAQYAARHADAANALAAWASVVKKASWRSLVDVRRTYRHADGVTLPSGKTVTIFNIRGNNYRLVAAIDYQIGIVNVLHFLTHAEYDKEQWKAKL
jgi:mRNA interferase HigB